jgi:hypothetical protein
MSYAAQRLNERRTARAVKRAEQAMARKTIELPLGDGPGVGSIKIPSIDHAAEDYIKARDRRCRMSPKEIAAKTTLIDLLHKHEKKIGRGPDGVLRYHYDDEVITLEPGKEKLKVKSSDEPEID